MVRAEVLFPDFAEIGVGHNAVGRDRSRTPLSVPMACQQVEQQLQVLFGGQCVVAFVTVPIDRIAVCEQSVVGFARTHTDGAPVVGLDHYDASVDAASGKIQQVVRQAPFGFQQHVFEVADGVPSPVISMSSIGMPLIRAAVLGNPEV